MDKVSGKILFYNEEKGEGIIVTRNKQKVSFNVSEWEDFDYLPKTALHVEFLLSGKYAVNISVSRGEGENGLGQHGQNDDISLEKEPLGTEMVINNYFSAINRELEKFMHYSKAEHSIDFLKLRRFLLTTYNNLVEIDINIRKSDVTLAKNDLIYVSNIYDEFRQKAKHVKKAFYELFLNRSDEFVAAENKLENNKEMIQQCDTNITMTEAALENLERIAAQTPPASENYAVVTDKIRVAKAKVVDEIHHKRELEDENLQLIAFIEMIINENEDTFREKFTVQGKKFDEKITFLLNRLAYSFDQLLWETARKSKPIKDFFRRSQIKGQLSSITYLKYYLQSLNQEKLSEENKELFEIVDYLQSLRCQSLLYLSSDIDNVMRLKPVIAAVDKSIMTEMTMDVDKAFEFILKKTPDFIFVDFQGEFKKLMKKLNENRMLEGANIILVTERANDKLVELAKRMNIEHVLQTRVSALAFTQEVTRIIEEAH